MWWSILVMSVACCPFSQAQRHLINHIFSVQQALGISVQRIHWSNLWKAWVENHFIFVNEYRTKYHYFKLKFVLIYLVWKLFTPKKPENDGTHKTMLLTLTAYLGVDWLRAEALGIAWWSAGCTGRLCFSCKTYRCMLKGVVNVSMCLNYRAYVVHGKVYSSTPSELLSW